MGQLTSTPLLPYVSGLPWKGVNYFCTTRAGGFSTGPWASLNMGLHTGDDAANVAENRNRLRSTLPAEPIWLKQVHGADVYDADAGPAAASPVNIEIPVADAAITSCTNRVIAIMTADCLPVVLASTDGQVLGVAHAGWRGLAAGVLEQTLDALRRRASAQTRWRAWIGPAISQSCFEVGPDVFDAFMAHDARSSVFFAGIVGKEKWLADLPALARHRLHQAGVDSVELSGDCTFRRADLYYSYRREPTTGRMATVAWLTGESAGKGLAARASDLP